MTAPNSARIWLIACMAMVALMVLVGGVTRLTESGLSIVEWKLFSGILPPMTREGWEAALGEYRSSPEYQHINKGMDIAAFQQIFWLEWLHRLLGRLVGLVFVLPLAFFWFSKRISPKLARQMLIASLMVGAQGTLGWLMVYSGLQDEPRVSPLRLAAHLSLAFILFCYVFWIYLQHSNTSRPSPQAAIALRPAAIALRIVIALIALQIVFGAFVAGMDAGKIYNTWPLMDGEWLPPQLFALSPWIENVYAYVPMVQWQHRSFAYVVFAAVCAFALRYRRCVPPLLLWHLVGIMALQFVLGVFTLIHEVPVTLGSAHQMIALLLIACAVRISYALPLYSQIERK